MTSVVDPTHPAAVGYHNLLKRYKLAVGNRNGLGSYLPSVALYLSRSSETSNARYDMSI